MIALFVFLIIVQTTTPELCSPSELAYYESQEWDSIECDWDATSSQDYALDIIEGNQE